ncbi:MltA domain-containing protein [Desulfosarcina sp. OttesenSCG-928-A07]|nr:MltA domain-containing protein [Desulfosarcina sp. OttesenSCG-928-G17]MDL2329798.1 MltA domain-containing protein [Desulfosarcina sp. OttesenSCG-928-A07]
MTDFIRSRFFARWVLLILWAVAVWCGTSFPSAVSAASAYTPETAMVRLDRADYPDFSDGLLLDNLVHGIDQSLVYLSKLPETRVFQFGPDSYTCRHLVESLVRLRNVVQTRPDPAALTRFITDHYRVYRSVGGPGGGMLFTGYYEPHLHGSLVPDGRYRYPVYSLPSDLVISTNKYTGKKTVGRIQGRRMVSYPDRKTIEADSGFYRKARPLAWVDNKVDLFFLHIQGSGRVYLSNGTFIRVHYDGTNGQPYRSIGKLLMDRGKILAEDMSMQAIKTYLAQHPEEVDAILNSNPSYVFFKIEASGPTGAIEVDLTPGRSVAVDRRVFPMAAPVFFQTRIPVIDGKGEIRRWMDFSAFALNQDTGGAIRGPGRVDIFWGNGPYAQIAAGHLKEPGAFFLLVLDPARMKPR